MNQFELELVNLREFYKRRLKKIKRTINNFKRNTWS